MRIYAVRLCSFSCDIMDESWIDSYFSSQEKAEDYILRKGLLDKGYHSVTVVTYELDKL